MKIRKSAIKSFIRNALLITMMIGLIAIMIVMVSLPFSILGVIVLFAANLFIPIGITYVGSTLVGIISFMLFQLVKH